MTGNKIFLCCSVSFSPYAAPVLLLLSRAYLFFTTIKVLFPLFKCYPKFLSQLHSSPPGFLVVCNMCVCATFVLILIKEGH